MNTRPAIACFLPLVVALGACSTKAETSPNGGSQGSIKTDFGVTDDTITLGALTDTSGIFKANGQGTTNGVLAWKNDVNSRGGVCGRKIEIDVQDHGYKPDNAMGLYEAMQPKILGFAHLLGTSVLSALKSKIVADNVLTVPGAWTSDLLGISQILMMGNTYDVEAINGLSWLAKTGKISDGDKVGHIYMDTEIGQNALRGVQFYAQKHDLNIVTAAVGAADTDMTATITKMKSAGVKAIILTVPSGATASAALQNQAQSLNVPMLGSSVTFSLPLLTDPAVADALKANFWMASSFAPSGTESDEAKKIAGLYKQLTNDPPSRDVVGGYIGGLAWEAILNEACDAKDLTRTGIATARSKTSTLDTSGLTGPMNFTRPGSPATRESFILGISSDAPDGTIVAADLFEADEAKNYKAPYEK